MNFIFKILFIVFLLYIHSQYIIFHLGHHILDISGFNSRTNGLLPFSHADQLQTFPVTAKAVHAFCYHNVTCIIHNGSFSGNFGEHHPFFSLLPQTCLSLTCIILQVAIFVIELIGLAFSSSSNHPKIAFHIP